MTWGQIIVVGLLITMSIATVAVCDITIIREIRKFRKAMRKFVSLLVEQDNE